MHKVLLYALYEKRKILVCALVHILLVGSTTWALNHDKLMHGGVSGY